MGVMKRTKILPKIFKGSCLLNLAYITLKHHRISKGIRL